jgi:sugar lactone lactonase YvrE
MKTTIHSSRGAPRRPVVGLWLLLVDCLLAGPSLRADTLYVSNYGDNSISQITADGVVTRFATVLPKPFGLAFDSRGNLYAASAQDTNRISLVRSNGAATTFSPLLNYFDATALAFDSRGRLYVASQGGFGVGRIGANGGPIAPFAGGFTNPFGLAFDREDNLYVADWLNGRITKIAPDKTQSIFATGLSQPRGLAFDAAGNLYVANSGNGRIIRIAPDATATTFAAGFSGPSGIAFDTAGNLYVANQSGTVSKVTPDGVVTTFASGLSQPLYIAVQPDPAPPSLWVPQQSPDAISQSGLRIAVRGSINTYYQVLYSEDLTTWTPFATNQVVASSQVQLADPDAAFAPLRFYQVRRLP